MFRVSPASAAIPTKLTDAIIASTTRVDPTLITIIPWLALGESEHPLMLFRHIPGIYGASVLLPSRRDSSGDWAQHVFGTDGGLGERDAGDVRGFWVLAVVG